MVQVRNRFDGKIGPECKIIGLPRPKIYQLDQKLEEAAGKGKRQVREYFLSKVPAVKERKLKNLLHLTNIMSQRKEQNEAKSLR